MRLISVLPLEALALVGGASAARLNFPSVATQTVQDGANAAQQRPSPTPTAARQLAGMELLRGRDYTMGQDTCGFGSAQPWITYECYLEDASCMNIGGYRGCCTSGSSACQSTMWTTCENYQSVKMCGEDYRTRCCQSGAPYCVTWEFKTDATTYSAFDCDTEDTMRVRELLATPLSLITTTTTDSGSPTASASPLSSSPSLASSSATGTTVSGSTTGGASDGGGGGDSGDSSSSSSSAVPVGAIAGAVVGGVALICCTILGLVYLRRRRLHSDAAGREKLSASPPPPPEGPQEISTSDAERNPFRVPHDPNDYPSPSEGPGSPQEPGEPVDPKTGVHVSEAPDTTIVEAPETPRPVFEVANTHAVGHDSNRAELP